MRVPERGVEPEHWLRRDTPVSPTFRQLGSFSLRDHHFIRTSCHMLVSRDGRENELPYSLGQCFSTFFASRPKMSDWARPQPLNTPTSVLYVGEFAKMICHNWIDWPTTRLVVAIIIENTIIFQKVGGQSRDPTKMGSPNWGRDPEVEKHWSRISHTRPLNITEGCLLLWWSTSGILCCGQKTVLPRVDGKVTSHPAAPWNCCHEIHLKEMRWPRAFDLALQGLMWD